VRASEQYLLLDFGLNLNQGFSGVKRRSHTSFFSSSPLPNTEVKLSLCFSLRGQQRTIYWTHNRGLM